jgi:peroxiredoxin
VKRIVLGALLAGSLVWAAPAAADGIDRYLRELQLNALPGERAPGFSLPKVDGGRTSLAEQQGKVVLVYFWATWCGYCRKELPVAIEKIVRARKGQPFTVLAVSIEEPRDLVASYVKGAGVTSSVLLDGDGAVARAGWRRRPPSGSAGRALVAGRGTREWDARPGAPSDALVAAPLVVRGHQPWPLISFSTPSTPTSSCSERAARVSAPRSTPRTARPGSR